MNKDKPSYKATPTGYQFYLYEKDKEYPEPYIWTCNITIAGDIAYVRGVLTMVPGVKEALIGFGKEKGLKYIRWERFSTKGDSRGDIIYTIKG